MIGSLSRILLSFLLAYLLFNFAPFQRTIFQSLDLGLDFLIDHLSHLRIRLQPEISTRKKSNAFDYQRGCPKHTYTSRLIHRDPLIIYIEHFLMPEEIQHLIEITENAFYHSTIYGEDGNNIFNVGRTSSSAVIPRHATPTVTCLEKRFAEFQGRMNVNRIEPLQVVKYESNQEFGPHFDFLPRGDVVDNVGQRITTFFTYLQANCTRGETEFIKVPFVESMHRQFCDILNCDEHVSEYGLRFRPIPGNSVFWYNVKTDGEEDHNTAHAGHPPGENGYKVGLNVWTHDRVLML